MDKNKNGHYPDPAFAYRQRVWADMAERNGWPGQATALRGTAYWLRITD